MTVYVVSISNRDKCDFDGVGLAQAEIAKKLRAISTPEQVRDLSLQQLLHNPGLLDTLSEEDVIYCNADPYAYVLFYIRHIKKLSFRIIRAVQTGPWNGYLLQEWLCSPFTLENDLILYISNYAKKLFCNIIPNLGNTGKHIVCYPELLELPQLNNLRPLKERSYAALYLGRIAHDKGFETALEAFEIAYRRDSTLRFCVVGQVHHLDYSNEYFSHIIDSASSYGVEFVNAIPHSSVFDYLAQSRCLLFPSTSNTESLGRVVLEACHCRTPVICAAHAEMPLIANWENMLSPNYRVGLNRTTSMHFPMGQPNPQDFASLIHQDNCPIDVQVLKERQKHWDLFTDIVLTNSFESVAKTQDTDSLLLPNIVLDGIPKINLTHALNKVSILCDSLEVLLRIGSNKTKVLEMLTEKSMLPERTEHFIKSINSGQFRVDNIGGFPMEACHLVDFNPYLRILDQE
jgi:hypothetical protein